MATGTRTISAPPTWTTTATLSVGSAHLFTDPVLRRDADGQGSETGAVRGIAVGNLDLDVVANAAAYDLFTVAPIRVGH